MAHVAGGVVVGRETVGVGSGELGVLELTPMVGVMVWKKVVGGEVQRVGEGCSVRDGWIPGGQGVCVVHVEVEMPAAGRQRDLGEAVHAVQVTLPTGGRHLYLYVNYTN